MAEAKRDPEREERITMEIVVDCYDELERALSPSSTHGSARTSSTFEQVTV
jgi:hypothetical protein